MGGMVDSKGHRQTPDAAESSRNIADRTHILGRGDTKFTNQYKLS